MQFCGSSYRRLKSNFTLISVKMASYEIFGLIVAQNLVDEHEKAIDQTVETSYFSQSIPKSEHRSTDVVEVHIHVDHKSGDCKVIGRIHADLFALFDGKDIVDAV